MKKINLVIVWVITCLLMETSLLNFLALWWLDYDKMWRLVINLAWLVTYSLKKGLSNYSSLCWWNALATCAGDCHSYEAKSSLFSKQLWQMQGSHMFPGPWISVLLSPFSYSSKTWSPSQNCNENSALSEQRMNVRTARTKLGGPEKDNFTLIRTLAGN